MKRVLALALIGFAVTSPASAIDSVPWKKVNGWSVYMDPTMGNACYVSTFYEDGTTLRLGYDFSEPRHSIYLAIGNDRWKKLVEPGKDYPVKVQFDNKPVWEVTARGMEFSGTHFLAVRTTDSNFAADFSRRKGLKATFKGRHLAALRLKGSAKAIEEMLNCQKTVNSVVITRNPQPAPEPPPETGPVLRKADEPFEL